MMPVLNGACEHHRKSVSSAEKVALTEERRRQTVGDSQHSRRVGTQSRCQQVYSALVSTRCIHHHHHHRLLFINIGRYMWQRVRTTVSLKFMLTTGIQWYSPNSWQLSNSSNRRLYPKKSIWSPMLILSNCYRWVVTWHFGTLVFAHTLFRELLGFLDFCQLF